MCTSKIFIFAVSFGITMSAVPANRHPPPNPYYRFTQTPNSYYQQSVHLSPAGTEMNNKVLNKKDSTCDEKFPNTYQDIQTYPITTPAPQQFSSSNGPRNSLYPPSATHTLVHVAQMWQPEKTYHPTSTYEDASVAHGSVNSNMDQSSKVAVEKTESQDESQDEETTLQTGMGNLNNEDLGLPAGYDFFKHHNLHDKGEILIHRPAPIIVKRPPTKVLVNHPPLVVKPAPVIFHRPPAIVVRPVIMNSKPQPVKVQPVYVKVMKPTNNPVQKEKDNGNGKDDCDDDNKQLANDYYENRNYYSNQGYGY